MAVNFGLGFPNGSPAWESFETLTQSTATAPQALNPRVNVSILGMGTATGSNLRNQYTLATTGVGEGTEKVIISMATGEASVFVAGPTTGRLPLDIAFEMNATATAVDALLASATAKWVFNADGDCLYLKFYNGTWHYLQSNGVTQATAT